MNSINHFIETDFIEKGKKRFKIKHHLRLEVLFVSNIPLFVFRFEFSF